MQNSSVKYTTIDRGPAGGSRCNLADTSFFTLFGDNSIHLLGQTRFGLPLKTG